MAHTSEMTHRKKISGRTKAALWLLIGPTALIITAFLLFALINLVFNPTFWPTPDTEPFAQTPIGLTILNIVFFFAGAVGTIAWLPGIIIGAVLLIKPPKTTQ